MPTILVIDDNDAVFTALDVLFSLHGIEAEHASDPATGLARIDQGGVDLVVQDMNFTGDTTSGAEGRDLFAEIRSRHADMPIILLTAWTQLEHAVELVKVGAADYLAKPWDDAKLVTTVRNLLDLGALARDRRRRSDRVVRERDELAADHDLCGMVYVSEAMHTVVRMALRVARSEVPVLITGPNGVGKEKLAEIIQTNSAVREGPFVRVNVGAIPKDLMEAELFGAEPGAYTGITKQRKGHFEMADGGTLFLDEIGELPLDGQVKLLRVLQSGEFQRLGASQVHRAQVRVITATNQDLDAAVREGRFREDLFYRIDVVRLELPALSRRPEDLLPMVEALLDAQHGLDASARSAVQAHDWPGNVRELENRISRAQLMTDGGEIRATDLGLAELSEGDGPDAAAIRQALERAGGTVAKAARALGLSRQALYRRMERFEISNDWG
jgi:DNA-binding NtrC family response regulator